MRVLLLLISDNPSQTDAMTEPARFPQEQLKMEFVNPIKANSDSLKPAWDRDSGISPTIGEIPELDSLPAAFKPRDEFDPEIFNRMN